MKINIILLFLAACTGIFLFTACDLDLIPDTDNKKATGAWEYGGGLHANSFRNFHYEFDLLSSDDTLHILLTTTQTDGAIWVYDPLGVEIYRNWGRRTFDIHLDNLNSGKYYIVVGTAARGEAGTFELEVGGNISDLRNIPSNTLEAGDDWHTNGGGNNHPESPRNHLYTVEVLKNNSAIDVIQTSDDTDVALWVYNTLNEQIYRNWGTRSMYTVEDANAGTYTIVAGTAARGVLEADYTLNVNGEIANLTRIPSQDTTLTASITNSTGRAIDAPTNVSYAFEVSANNTAFDVILSSADYDVALWVLDPLNNPIHTDWGRRSMFTVEASNTGTYKIVCGTSSAGDSGTFKLSLAGYYGNFRRL